RRLPERERPSRAVDEASNRVAQTGVGPIEERFDLACELPGAPEVIGIKEGNERAARRADAAIAGRRPFGAWLAETPDAGIVREARDDAASFVRRAVVDDHEVPVCEGLSADALDRLREP